MDFAFLVLSFFSPKFPYAPLLMIECPLATSYNIDQVTGSDEIRIVPLIRSVRSRIEWQQMDCAWERSSDAIRAFLCALIVSDSQGTSLKSHRPFRPI